MTETSKNAAEIAANEGRPMTRARQQDAHVRARKRLISRVVDRAVEWGSTRGVPAGGLDAWAAAGVDAFDWAGTPDWGIHQTGRYYPGSGYDGPKVPYKDVPTDVIHSMMIAAMQAHRRAN